MTARVAGRRRSSSAVAFSVPKLGRTTAENEDSVAVDVAAGRFAVADGASTSARPEVWSRLLVECFVGQQADPLEPAVLEDLRRRWDAEVMRPHLPWYAQAKLQEGAGSTFLGLHVDPTDSSFRARAVGDSCFFHLRGRDAVAVGPISHPDQFSRYPELVRTVPGSAAEATVIAGEYEPGDMFLLATDAFASLLLEIHHRFDRISSVARLICDRTQFVRRVAAYRRRGSLANDDTTLCVVRT